MIHAQTIAGRKEHFFKKRERCAAAWVTDAFGAVHIPLGKRRHALIDAKDKELASQFSWHLHRHRKKTFYAEAHVPQDLRAQYGEWVALHRLVLKAPKGAMVRHCSKNGLDCRRRELRLVIPNQSSFI